MLFHCELGLHVFNHGADSIHTTGSVKGVGGLFPIRLGSLEKGFVGAGERVLVGG